MGSDLALQQQVETLYQQTTESDQEFCIDLEGQAPDGQRLWEWAHLSRADSARRSVIGKQHLIEGEHYLLHRSVEQVTSSNGVTQSREMVRIVFSLEGFELWLLMLDTDRGHQIRQFFRECHKRLQLSMSQPTALNGVISEIQALAKIVGYGFNGVQSDLKEVKTTQADHTKLLVSHSARLDQLEKSRHRRKDPPLKHKRQYEHLVATAYGGACPCCKQQKAHMQFDHWYDRSRADLDEVWLICTDCNRKLGAAGSPEREHYRRQFEGFHDRLSELTTGNQIKLDFGSIHEPA